MITVFVSLTVGNVTAAAQAQGQSRLPPLAPDYAHTQGTSFVNAYHTSSPPSKFYHHLAD